MNRRHFLTSSAASAATAVGALTAGPVTTADTPETAHAAPPDRPVALVYRGPASCPGCSEAVAALLANGPVAMRPVFCGPHEALDLGPATLAGATVYAQPGGGEVGSAWRKIRAHADDLRAWLYRGGNYLGFCLGGYLAGTRPGFGLLPGDAQQYITSSGATVRDETDTVVPVTWRDTARHMYFQDGPLFHVDPTASTVLGTYDTGVPAAVVTTYGAGRVGVVGPHPEADQSWYDDEDLTNPDGVRFDLGHDLIAETLIRRPAPR